MEQKHFFAIMPYIIVDLVKMITKKTNMSEVDSIELLYNSRLYALLEQEETKLWHYSTDMLYYLFKQEQKTGNIVFPDV